MKKLMQKILKHRTSVSFILSEKTQISQWIAFGKFTIHKSLKDI